MQKTCTSYIECKEDKKFLFQKGDYPILECKKCGHRFTEIPDSENHLASVYSDDYFFAGNTGYPDYFEGKGLLYNQGKRYARLIAKYTKPGKILDVGCAAGFILKSFEQAGWNCYGIEPNETMVAYGRRELELDIQKGDLETFKSGEQFDLISMIQVIGHVHDLDKAMKNVAHLLKPSGFVLVESWDMKSPIARIFGKRWHEYSPPTVVHWYSDKTLKILFEYYGFELVAKGYPFKKIRAKHAFSLMESKVSNPFIKKCIRFLNSFLSKFTFINPSFDVKWYIFEKFE